uniref:Uncharacterized protein n=1 Tax=Ficus carica TaxID=3494 RepID=A0AA88EDT4_FICCA|nr:hypothetical protein TIFTF001_055301 [Ficus carica]GMN72957.1 hypothetical protein TIFTF001_055303 [Ficus carica]
MAEEIKVEITRRETIKPSSPTPQHLRSVEFSIMDQLAPDFHVPLVLFYPFSSSADSLQRPPLDIASERVQRKLSPSSTLWPEESETIFSLNATTMGQSLLKLECPV